MNKGVSNTMKIAVSVQESQRSTMMDPRFGRAQHFAIFDTENQTLEFLSNDSKQSVHGAGTQTTQILLNLGVQKIFSGAFGPNAADALNSAGIEMESVAEAASVSLESILAKLG
jgi:predicted Fe-Mo cluster-binding NifX family protein